MDSSPAAPQRAETGDPPAADRLEEVFVRHQDELLGMLYCLIGNAEDARDALQEAFLKCWRRADGLGEIENLRAWVFQVAMNAGRDLRGTAWRRHRRPLEPQTIAQLADSQCSEAEAARREQLALVRQALVLLRPEEQEVFLLRENGQMTYEEIATATGIPVGTVKTRMRLAITKLREALEGT